MKFTCNQSQIASAVSLVIRAVPSKPTHPILSNVLLVVNSDSIQLTGFDLAMGITTGFSGNVSESGVLAVPAKTLLDIVSKLEGEITLFTESDGEVLNIKSKKGKYQIRCIPGDEYPELPAVSTKPISLPAPSLLQGLKGSLFCASTDETKQVLTGVHIKSGLDNLEFAATDGHRLAVAKSQVENKVDLDVTIPAKSLFEFSKILTGSNDESSVDIKLDNGICLFDIDGTSLVTRTLEGMYPTYNTLIPKQFSKSVVVDKKELLATLDRVSVMTNADGVVKFDISTNQQITVSSENQDSGNASEVLDARISGDDITVAFNVKYLIDGLKAIQSTEIQIHLNTELTPVIFTPLSGGNSMLYLAMPIQLRS